MPFDKQDVPAVLLVGGMGTRLRCQGIRSLVFCTGYLADQIESYFGDGNKWDVSIEYSKELQPLGTAGAVKLAEPYLKDAAEFLVMNGDSFMEVDLDHLLQLHHEHKAIVSMAVRRVENASRYGTVRLEAGSRVTGFIEKTGSEGPGVVNAGVYIFNHEVLQHIPEGPRSLEKDVFPGLLSHGVYALEQQGVFIDIGTPEDYARAQKICDRLYEAASLKQ